MGGNNSVWRFMAKKTEGGVKTARKIIVKKEKKPTDKLADKTALTKFCKAYLVMHRKRC